MEIIAGLNIKTPGLHALRDDIRIVPPSTQELEGIFILGGSLAQSVINRSPLEGKRNAAVIGAPVVSANGLTLSNRQNYLDTGIAETDDMTLIAWHTAEYLTCTPISNTWGIRQGGTGSSYGVALRSSGGSDMRKSYSGRMGVRASSVTTGNGDGISASHLERVNSSLGVMAHAARFNASQVKHDLLTTGTPTTTTTVADGTVRDKSASSLLLGTDMIAAVGVDPFLMCGAAIYSRALSDAELRAFYDWLKIYEFRMRGLAV